MRLDTDMSMNIVEGPAIIVDTRFQIDSTIRNPLISKEEDFGDLP